MAKKPPIITLLSDFGTDGPYVAAMKGAILEICPGATIVDLTHDVPAHDVWAGSFLLDQATRDFPSETVHVGVVDPGVGSQRTALAGRFGENFFVFPDNGLISFVQASRPCQGLATVRNQQYTRRAISMTFHGRDVFAPVAAHLASGVNLQRLGPTPQRYTLLDVPQPFEDAGVVHGRIIYVDRFGNCVSNLPVALLDNAFENLQTVEVWCNGRQVGPLVGTYSFVEPGRGLALINSMGLLEIAANQARASEIFDARVGTQVHVVAQG